MEKKYDGVADGTTITTTNGTGDTLISVGSGWTVQSAAHPHGGIGAAGARLTLSASASQLAAQVAAASGTVATRYVHAFWLTIPSGASCTSSAVLATIDVHTVGTQACQLKLTTAMKLRLAPSSADLAASDSPALAAGVYLVQFAATAGASSTTGIAEMYITALDGTLVHAYRNAAVDCKTAELGRGRIGGLTTSNVSGWSDFDVADWQIVQKTAANTTASDPANWISLLRRSVWAPQAALSSSGFTTTGAASAALALQDALNSSYIEGSSGTVDLLLNPLKPGSQIDIAAVQQYVTSSPTTKTLSYVDGPGGTVLKTWTLTPGSSLATQAMQMTTETASVTHWDYPVLRVTVA